MTDVDARALARDVRAILRLRDNAMSNGLDGAALSWNLQLAKFVPALLFALEREPEQLAVAPPPVSEGRSDAEIAAAKDCPRCGQNHHDTSRPTVPVCPFKPQKSA